MNIIKDNGFTLDNHRHIKKILHFTVRCFMEQEI